MMYTHQQTMLPYFLFTIMTQASNTDQAFPSVLQAIKDAISKLNWKHGLILSASVAIIIYPQPVIRLLLPIFSKISNNHQSVTSKNNIKEIILTSNEGISLDSIEKLQITKGLKPRIKEFSTRQCKVLETPRFKLRRSGLFQSGASLSGGISQETILLCGQTLWNNFRIARLQDNQTQLVLIKSSEPILRVFLLRFYGMAEGDIHKIGSLSSNKMHILRLDERVGTYEHVIIDISPLEYSLK